MSEALRILIIDDEAGAPGERGKGRSPALARELTGAGHDAEALGPDSVTRAHIEDRDLILVDYRITEEWTPHKAPLVQRPLDGLAVLGVIRSWLDSWVEEEKSPTGLALHSAKLDELGKGMVLARAEHVVARLHGLEWAFSKKSLDDLPPRKDRVAALAAAVRELGELPRGESWGEALLTDVLSLPEGPWRVDAERQLEVAQLPRDELIKANGGLVALRWLAHRVLPYPGALIGQSYTAALLGIHVDVLKDNQGVQKALQGYRYKGVLADLLGPRWWRAGIEHQLSAWEPSGIALANEASVEALSEQVGEPIEPALGMVACVDSEFEPAGRLASKLDCVRLRPDDWPVFATPAWMRIADVNAGDLECYVDPADQELLKS